MSARTDGIEAFDRGDDFWIDNPYKYGKEGYAEWTDGFIWSSKIEMEIEQPEMYEQLNPLSGREV